MLDALDRLKEELSYQHRRVTLYNNPPKNLAEWIAELQGMVRDTDDELDHIHDECLSIEDVNERTREAREERDNAVDDASDAIRDRETATGKLDKIRDILNAD